MSLKKSLTVISVILTILYTVWWVWLSIFVPQESDLRNGYSLTYGFIAGFGGIVGFIAASKWEGFKSYVGKSLIFFAFGLLCQFLGQTAYSVQFYFDHVENAYPGFGEIFFFISMPSYILAVWFIAKAAGFQNSLANIKSKIVAIGIPVLMVLASYYMFIRGSSTDGQSFVAVALNFAYPIGQAMFVSLAIVTYMLSGKILGGLMKKRVVFILFSLFFQYIADSVFLYQTIQGTWYHADISEYLFALSYCLMTFAFLEFLDVFDKLKSRK